MSSLKIYLRKYLIAYDFHILLYLKNIKKNIYIFNNFLLLLE